MKELSVLIIIPPDMAKTKTKIYSVSQVNALIKVVLENNIPPRLTIRAEISNFRPNASGHAYFSLKDEFSTIPCAMWKSRFAKLKFHPENGAEVLATGSIDVYVPHGRYQFIVDSLQPAGIGDLHLAFEKMKKKLLLEGLFDVKCKKPLPPFPFRIGILTSPTGAAIHDITDSILSRWPCAKMFLYSVPVQGETAAQKIVAALSDINKKNKKLNLDILIVARGGGSLEDLWPFNEEILARAIFESKIPVISAVGHETDTTIADLVADARASTPTKAGVTAVPDAAEIHARLNHSQNRLASHAAWQLELAKKHLQTITARALFQDPLLIVHNRQQQLDEIRANLLVVVKDTINSARDKLSQNREKIAALEFGRVVIAKRIELNDLANRLSHAIVRIINTSRLNLAAAQSKLSALNPKAVLKRGYCLTTNKKTGRVVARLEDVKIGDFLITELSNENLIESRVTKKQNKEN